MVRENSSFNLWGLKRLYKVNNKGNGIPGEKRRVHFHTSITPLTYQVLGDSIQLGKGSYASPLVELSIRIVLAMVGRIPILTVAQECAYGFLDRVTLVQRLRELAAAIEAFKG